MLEAKHVMKLVVSVGVVLYVLVLEDLLNLDGVVNYINQTKKYQWHLPSHQRGIG